MTLARPIEEELDGVRADTENENSGIADAVAVVGTRRNIACTLDLCERASLCYETQSSEKLDECTIGAWMVGMEESRKKNTFLVRGDA